MNFKEWFKRIDEGVFVGVDIPEDKRKKEPPAMLDDLIARVLDDMYRFSNTLPKKHPELDYTVTMNNLKSDGFDGGKKDGTVNFYTEKLWGPEITKKLLDQLKKEMEKEGATVGTITSNTYADAHGSNPDKHTKRYLRDKGVELGDTRVYRIPVKLDPEAAKDNMPSVNMGYKTAKKVLEGIFGLDSAGPDPTDLLAGNILAGIKRDADEDWKGDTTEDWNGYQFSADQIIKTFERLLTPPRAKAFIKDSANKGKEIPYAEFLANYMSMPISGEMESDGKAKFGGITLPAGVYYFYRNGDMSVVATPPNDDLERESKMISTPNKVLAPGFIQGGVSSESIFEKAQEVYRLALWAKKHGFDKMFGD